jgi:hypothetical protein
LILGINLYLYPKSRTGPIKHNFTIQLHSEEDATIEWLPIKLQIQVSNDHIFRTDDFREDPS